MDEAVASQLAYWLNREITGRRTLVRRTGLAESTVRTNLNKLKAGKYIRSTKLGTRLTPQGHKAFRPILEKVKAVYELDLAELKLDSSNSAALIKGIGSLKELWKYRDLAVRAGATAALFLRFTRGDLHFADTGQKVARRNPKDAHQIKKILKATSEGDWIVIVFAGRRAEANKGLWEVLSRALKDAP